MRTIGSVPRPAVSRVRPLLISVIGLMFIAGCTTAGESAGESAAGQSAAAQSAAAGGTTVNVTLAEFSVAPDKTEVPAGSVTFQVTNNGPDDVHEFVVIKTDLDAGSLPTDSTGAVDESAGDMEVIDEIEDIAVGSSETLTVDLEAGSYVLICNIYDADEQEAHYSEGMRAAFTVT
jgi:uncharacterized cupredoxin-like copper-binding protein